MATGTVILPVGGAYFDATNPPGVGHVQSRMKLLFDDTTPEICRWVFRMPSNYASAPVGKIQYAMASGVANEVEFEVSVMAVSDGDSQDLDADSFDTANSGSATVPGTAGYLDEISVTLSNADSVAAGDWVCIMLARDADDATNDDATGDAEVWAMSLEYTTT